MSAARHADGVLEDAIRAATQTQPGQPLTAPGHGLLLAHWSMAHGFAHLALGGERQGTTGGAPPGDTLVKSLLPQMLLDLQLP